MRCKRTCLPYKTTLLVIQKLVLYTSFCAHKMRCFNLKHVLIYNKLFDECQDIFVKMEYTKLQKKNEYIKKFEREF